MAQKAKKKTPSKTVKTAAAKPVAKTTAPKAVKKAAPKKTAAKKSTAKKAAPKKAVAQTPTQVQPTVRKGVSPVHEAKKQKNYFMLALIVAVIVGLFALTVVKVGG